MISEGQRTRTDLASLGPVLAASLVLGAVGDVFLLDSPWGINIAVWTVTAAVLLVAVSGRLHAPLSGDAWVFVVLAPVCASFVAWRDSSVLGALDLTAALLALSLASFRLSTPWRRATLPQYGRGLALTGLWAGFGSLTLAADVAAEPPIALSAGANRSLKAVARGAVITVPSVVVFGGLLLAADATFEGLVDDLIAVDLGRLTRHGVFVFTVAYLTCGVLAGRFLAKADHTSADAGPARQGTLGLVEAGILLGSINLLFGLFVATQLPYLFGGEATLTATAGLTAADYARRGFFELLMVMAIAVPLLLLVEWATDRHSRRSRLIVRSAAGLTVLLLLVIMASALLRLRLYADSFGLTEARVYAAAILAWLGLVLLILALTALRGRREQFAFAATLAAFAVLLGLNLAGPDGLVASTNLDRPAGQGVDLTYLSGLSADAVPALVAGLPSLTRSDRARLTATLTERWGRGSGDGWRSWNRARARAAALAEALPESPDSRD